LRNVKLTIQHIAVIKP